MNTITFPRSPFDLIEGMVYFRRLCDKVRLHEANQLPEDYHANLGRAMDLWTCQLLGVEYSDLAKQVVGGAKDEEALAWAWDSGERPAEHVLAWWNSFMRNFGHRDDFSDRLEERKSDAGLAGRKDIVSFFLFMDAEEGHSTDF